MYYIPRHDVCTSAWCYQEHISTDATSAGGMVSGTCDVSRDDYFYHTLYFWKTMIRWTSLFYLCVDGLKVKAFIKMRLLGYAQDLDALTGYCVGPLYHIIALTRMTQCILYALFRTQKKAIPNCFYSFDGQWFTPAKKWHRLKMEIRFWIELTGI